MNQKKSLTTNLLPQLSGDYADHLIEGLGKTFSVTIGTINQIAENAIDTAVDAIIEAGLNNFAIKMYINKVYEDFSHYKKKHCRMLGDRNYLWQDMTRLAADSIEPDVLKLKYSIKSVLDKNNIDRSGLRADVFTADALIQTAVSSYDHLVGAFQKQTLWKIDCDFRHARLIKAQRAWAYISKFMEYTGKREVDINLNTDPQCELAMKIIINRFTNHDFLNDSAGEALRLNPMMSKYAKEAERHLFNIATDVEEEKDNK